MIQPASKTGFRRKPGSPPKARPTSVRTSSPAMVSMWTVRLSAVAQSAKQFVGDAMCGGQWPRLAESRGHDTSSTVRKSRKLVPTPGRPHALEPAATKSAGTHREIVESVLHAARHEEGHSGAAAIGWPREHATGRSKTAKVQRESGSRTQPPNVNSTYQSSE